MLDVELWIVVSSFFVGWYFAAKDKAARFGLNNTYDLLAVCNRPNPPKVLGGGHRKTWQELKKGGKENLQATKKVNV